MAPKKRRSIKQGKYLALAGLILTIIGLYISTSISPILSSILFWGGIFLVFAGAIVYFSNQETEPRSAGHTVAESPQPGKINDTHGRDPVLHYEVTEGHFGDPSRQSITYTGKKARWR